MPQLTITQWANIGTNYGTDGFGAGHVTVQDNAAFSINGNLTLGVWGVGTLDVRNGEFFSPPIRISP